MSKKVCTKDGLANIGNDENPPKGASESKVEGEGACTVSRNRGVVDGSQAGAILSIHAFSTGRRYDTHFRTGIDKKAEARCAVVNVK